MDDSASLASFIDKWRQRWPEWALLAGFVPPPQRARVAAWFALLQELRDAAWGGSDPTPGLAKLAWWQEELRGWSRGGRRHPLGEALQKVGAPWDVLAASLSALPATRASGPADEDVAALDGFAAAVLACEAVLFDGASPHVRHATDVADVVAADRAERAWIQGGATAAMAIPPPGRDTAMTRPRRLQQAALRERLRALDPVAGRARPSPLRLVMAGWRAARGT
jgi:hypothetical protein